MSIVIPVEVIARKPYRITSYNVCYTKLLRDLTLDQEALGIITSMGYRQVPVVVTEEDHWSGFRPDKIAALV